MKNISTPGCFLAVDIGATSGREVVCFRDNAGRFRFEEVHRFPNAILNVSGHYYWDIFAIYASIIEGFRKCVSAGYHPESIGIDTWGVDFGFVADDGTILGLPRAYTAFFRYSVRLRPDLRHSNMPPGCFSYRTFWLTC